jgi:hypothetical protein
MTDEGMTYEELRTALAEGRAIAKHTEEIRQRLHSLLGMPELVHRSGHQLLTDAIALQSYLQLMLDENDRLVAFLMGLEEAGTITRKELELLMGLRRGSRFSGR